MSLFSKVFGGKKDAKSPTATEAIQKLRETEEMLLKKQEFLEKKIQIEVSLAKKFGLNDKRAALQALRRKKRYEKQLQQVDGTLATIEMQRESLESANTNTAILQTMKLAADTLKNANKNLDVDQVHEMLDDIAEQQEVAKEITGAISNPIAFGTDVDEEELEKELERLEQEELDKELLASGATDKLPPVPTVPVPAKPKPRVVEEDDDDELKQLEKWAT